MSPTARMALVAAALAALLLLVRSPGVQAADAAPRPKATPAASLARLEGVERRRLLEVLRPFPSPVLIVCAGTWCQGLAEDLAGVFRDAAWKVQRTSSGGLGVDGVRGILVNGCGGIGDRLRRALTDSTKRKIDHVDDGPCQTAGDQTVAIVLGH